MDVVSVGNVKSVGVDFIIIPSVINVMIVKIVVVVIIVEIVKAV